MTEPKTKLKIDAQNVLTWETPKEGDPLMFLHLRRFAKAIIDLLDETEQLTADIDAEAQRQGGPSL